MARDEAKVRVKLDTRRAEADLRGLNKTATATAKRVGSGIRRSVGRGLTAVGLGGGVGVGLAAVRGATESGFGDVIGEAFGGIGAQLAEAIFGNLDEDARASKFARQATTESFGFRAGLNPNGPAPPGSVNFFNQIKARRLIEERGKEFFERDERFRGPGFEDIIKRIMGELAKLLREATDGLAVKLALKLIR